MSRVQEPKDRITEPWNQRLRKNLKGHLAQPPVQMQDALFVYYTRQMPIK